MKVLPIFLNHASIAIPEENDLIGLVFKWVETLKIIYRLRPKISIHSEIPLSELTFGSECLSLAYFYGNNRDFWRFFGIIPLKSPWTITEIYTDFGERDIRIDGHRCNSFALALIHDSFIFSLDVNPWVQHELEAIEFKVVGETTISEVTTVRNIAKSDHVLLHEDIILNYGASPSSSSVVYRGPNYYFAMYLHDHEPPHIHICSSDNGHTCAKVNLDTFDIMEGSLIRLPHREIMRIIRDNIEVLQRGWIRSRSGDLPLIISD